MPVKINIDTHNHAQLLADLAKRTSQTAERFLHREAQYLAYAIKEAAYPERTLADMAESDAMAHLTGLPKKAISYNAEHGNIPFIKTSCGMLFDPIAIKEFSIQNAMNAQKQYAHPLSDYKPGSGCDIDKLIDLKYEKTKTI